MSEVAEKQKTEKSGAVGSNGTPEKKPKKEKVRVVTDTEIELAAIVPPTDGKGNAKGRFIVHQGSSVLGYTYAFNRDEAISNVLRKKPVVTAKRLDKLPDVAASIAELLSMNDESFAGVPPEHLKQLVAKVNASAHLASNPPKASHRR